MIDKQILDLIKWRRKEYIRLTDTLLYVVHYVPKINNNDRKVLMRLVDRFRIVVNTCNEMLVKLKRRNGK